MALHIKIQGLLYFILYSISSILGALMSFIFIYSDLVFQEFHAMNFELIHFNYPINAFQQGIVLVILTWNHNEIKCKGLKTFFK